MHNVTLYQIGYLLGVLFVIGGVVWSVFQIARRLFTNQIDSKRKMKRGVFVLIGSPVLLTVIWGCSILAFLILLTGRDFIGTAYAKRFLAGDCYPVTYPTKEIMLLESNQTISYETSDPPDAVAGFFTDAFSITIWESDSLWEITSNEVQHQDNYTLSCFSNLGGGFKEQSCIFIETTHAGSLIETYWSIIPPDFPGGCFK
jgi:hypothetical protein